MANQSKQVSMFEPTLLRGAIKDSFVKLDPRLLYKNPVMFVVMIGSVLTTVFVVRDLIGTATAPLWFSIAITLWLWFTVLFANFAEAVAEGRGKAQADSLRKMRQETSGRKLSTARKS